MTVAFSNYSMLNTEAYAGAETIVVPASTTKYINPTELTMWDSKDGVFFTIRGTRYGTLATDVSIQLQQATLRDAPLAAWENLGAAISFGSGGTIGSPSTTYLTVSASPAPGTSFMNYIRLAITTQAGASCTISKLYRSSRGR